VAFQRRIAANRAAQMAVGGAVGIGIVGFLGSVLLSLQFLAHYPASSRLMAWCQMFGSSHHPVSNPVGALAIAFSVAGLVGSTRFVFKHRAARRVHEELRSLIDQPILLDSSKGVFAYTLPGLQPLTVLSAGLVTQLDVDEQAVVLAHEQAHHQYRHDRFLVASRVASALFFPANIFGRAVEHSLERWADEHAADVVGDRKLVAITVARTALLANQSEHSSRRVTPFGVLGFTVASPFSTTQRVRSLLRPPQRFPFWAVGLSLGAVVGLLTQLHHFEAVVRSLCRM
jgi:Peptidase family M48